MLELNIHPRIRERRAAVAKDHGSEVMDRQVRVYCLLNRAARKLKELEVIQDADGSGEARYVLDRAARVIREQAIRGAPDQHELLTVYADLEQLSRLIADALEGRSTS